MSFGHKQLSERKERWSSLEDQAKSGATHFGYTSQNSVARLHVMNYKEDRKCGLAVSLAKGEMNEHLVVCVCFRRDHREYA